LLAGRTVNEIMDAVVEAVRPVDSTQDSEASRKAIKGCLSEVLERFPDVNLLELTDEQRAFAVERYVALDVFQRFALDLGKTIQDNAPSPRAVLSRLKEVKGYVRETVSAAFRKLRSSTETGTRERGRGHQGRSATTEVSSGNPSMGLCFDCTLGGDRRLSRAS
jgi:hypothetical protein